MPGPGWGECTGYRRTGPGGPPLGLGLNEGLGSEPRRLVSTGRAAEATSARSRAGHGGGMRRRQASVVSGPRSRGLAQVRGRGCGKAKEAEKMENRTTRFHQECDQGEATWPSRVEACHDRCIALPNVRAKPAPTAGRQARVGENVPRTAKPGLVARRWGSA